MVCYEIGEGCFHENEIKCYLEIYQGVDDDFDNVDLDCWQHLPRWLVMAQSQDFWGGRLWGNSFCVWLFCVWFCDNDSVFVFSRFWFGVWVLSYLVIGFICMFVYFKCLHFQQLFVNEPKLFLFQIENPCYNFCRGAGYIIPLSYIFSVATTWITFSLIQHLNFTSGDTSASEYVSDEKVKWRNNRTNVTASSVWTLKDSFFEWVPQKSSQSLFNSSRRLKRFVPWPL